MTVDRERLQRLLGRPETERLLVALRRNRERGGGDTITLSQPSDTERLALEQLLGRRARIGKSVQVQISEVHQVLVRAGIADSLEAALEALGGPLLDRQALQREQAARWERAFSSVTATAETLDLMQWLNELKASGLLKRLSKGEPGRAQRLLEQALRVLERLPVAGLGLSTLAAEVLGDAHGLDRDRPLASLVRRALALRVGQEGDDSAEDERALWASAGVLVGGDITSMVLALNLPVVASNAAGSGAIGSGGIGSSAMGSSAMGSCAIGSSATGSSDNGSSDNGSSNTGLSDIGFNATGSSDNGSSDNGSSAARYSATGRAIAALGEIGEPFYLTLRQLVRQPPGWDCRGRRIYICENPALVAEAANRLGVNCAPLVATLGRPRAAAMVLLAQLRAAGAELHYRGDLDWAGIAIGNTVINRFGATPWRFDSRILHAFEHLNGRKLVGNPVPASWDAELSPALEQRGKALEEEQLLELLLSDLGGF